MTFDSFARLTDVDLIARTKQATAEERRTTTELVVLLAELDTRRLYLAEGCSSLFTYCTQVLRLSEAAAYSRITAARTARRFPSILPLLSEGEITLTTVGLLSAHLTDENHETLLSAARKRSRREVEQLVSALVAAPDVPSTLRRLPALKSTASSAGLLLGVTDTQGREASSAPSPPAPLVANPGSSRPSVVAPLAPARYLLRVTLTRGTHDKLERAKALLRYVIPNGDLGAILDRALTLLVKDVERKRVALTSRPPRNSSRKATPVRRSRIVPAAVKRAVWTRDQARCAFIGTEGRCVETSFLEFHHVTPFAAGGPTSVDNLALRCRAHNQFEATEFFGQPSPTEP